MIPTLGTEVKSREKLAMGMAEGAGVIGLSHRTIRKLIAGGRVPVIGIRPSALERLVDDGRQKNDLGGLLQAGEQ